MHVFCLLPPLEHAPDQIASRPLLTLSVTEVPVENCADWFEPTATLIPLGLEDTVSPARPLAWTSSADFCGGGGGGTTVRFADCVTPPPVTEIVTTVGVETTFVMTLKPPVVDPVGMMTEPGIVTTEGLLLVICSVSSEEGAESTLTVAKEPVLPDAVLGFNVMEAGLP